MVAVRYRSEASERVVKGLALVNGILDALGHLAALGDIDRATYCTDAVRWLGVKTQLLRTVGWHREAAICDRLTAELLADPVFYPPACGAPRCFVRPGVEHHHPQSGVTVMGQSEPDGD